MKKKYGLLIRTIIILVFSISCNFKTGGDKYSKFPDKINNGGTPIKEGVLKVGIVTGNPLPQIYNEVLNVYEKNFVIGFTDSYIFDYDINSKITKKGAAEFSLDKKNKKFKIKIKNNMKWSDGHSLNADDIIFTYETVINKDFPNENYGYDYMNIVGGEEYHNGQVSTISGIKKIDDRTVEVSFKEFSPGLSTPVDGMLAVALLPKHHLKDIPVKNLLNSDKVKINPVTLGAYIPVNITENKIILKANIHLYKGKAKTAQAVIEGKNIGEIMPFIKAGAYDLVYNMPNYAYEGIEKLNNMKIMGDIKNHVDVLIFNLGIYDKVKKENITDPSMKMSDIRLRKALAYALNIEEIEKNFSLTVKASSIIPPAKYNRQYFNGKLKGYEYNPGKAKQLLDEAGYKDVDGDGYREDKNGNYFEIKMAVSQNNSEVWFFAQNWKDIGIRTKIIRRGSIKSLLEFIDSDDKNIDVYFMGMYNINYINPSTRFGRKAVNSFSRFSSEENDKLLGNIISKKGIEDENYRIKANKKWQEYYSEQLPIVPLMYVYEIYLVNRRIKKVTSETDISDLELTAPEPIKNK